jgi:hypothetical protein
MSVIDYLEQRGLADGQVFAAVFPAVFELLEKVGARTTTDPEWGLLVWVKEE